MSIIDISGVGVKLNSMICHHVRYENSMDIYYNEEKKLYIAYSYLHIDEYGVLEYVHFTNIPPKEEDQWVHEVSLENKMDFNIFLLMNTFHFGSNFFSGDYSNVKEEFREKYESITSI